MSNRLQFSQQLRKSLALLFLWHKFEWHYPDDAGGSGVIFRVFTLSSINENNCRRQAQKIAFDWAEFLYLIFFFFILYFENFVRSGVYTHRGEYQSGIIHLDKHRNDALSNAVQWKEESRTILFPVVVVVVG